MYKTKEWQLYYHVLGTKTCPERWAGYPTNIPPTAGKHIMIIIIIMPTYLSQSEVAVNTNP